MQSLLEIVGAGALLPAMVCGLLLLVSMAGDGRAQAARPLAASLGFLSGYAALTWMWGQTSFDDPWHWLPASALFAAGAEMVARNKLTPALAWCLRAGIAVGVGYLLVDEKVPGRSFAIAGFGIAMFVLWVVLDGRTRYSGPFVPALLLAVAIVGSAVLEASGNMKLAQLGEVFGAVLGATGLLAWRYPNHALARDAVPCIVVVLLGLMLQGQLNNYAEISIASLLLVALSPIGLAVGQLKPLQKLHRPRLVEGAAVLVPAIAGLALALIQSGLAEE